MVAREVTETMPQPLLWSRRALVVGLVLMLAGPLVTVARQLRAGASPAGP